MTITEVKESKGGLDNPDVDKFDGMVKWMKDHGAKFPKLYMKYYTEDYRGVHCLTKIPPEDVVLYVPLKIIMTSEVAKSSDIGKKIIASGCEVRSKHSYLAAYLLQEKYNPKSYWKPYLDILPQKYANMPVFFDEPTLGWLKNSMSLQKISDRIDSLRREYDNIRRHVPEFAKFTLEEFIWGRFVVITRIFGLVIEGNKTDGLVPYADMLNHKKPCSDTGPVKSDEADTKWTYEDSRGGFIITTTRTIPRAEQIFDSYGRKCNSRFFVNYGFSLDDNEDNEVMIRVGLPQNDPHFTMKLRMLGGREHSARREFQIPASYGHKKVKELFSFMRFINAQDAELMMLSAGENFKLEEVGPISLRNEKKVLQDLRKASADMYGGFPETLEHDNKMLEGNELVMYSNLRNCVVMRRGEKQVLRWFMDLADKALPLLDLPWKDLKRTAAKGQAKPGTIDQYITAVIVPLVKDKK
jgi:histone-lysine N-methyltransferase SETD3